MDWKELLERIENALPKQRKGLKVFGVPRGGAIIAGIAWGFGVEPVTDLAQADLIIDDVIETGKTRTEIMLKRDSARDVQFIGIIDKLRSSEFRNVWVEFPWERYEYVEDPESDK
jgi:hypothetical protein